MVFLTILCTSLAYSQDVSGTVSDASGPLPGASILVKGTTNGAQTDLDGKFTIKNVGSNAVLVFSYIGLKSQEVNVAGKSSVKVVLKEDSAELKEVVVIGYGSV
ncbi:MAG: carboxypeptidase-like regulatory domain-containing protein, partial [Flavobacterium sp.]|nr:carboxypeptidase-like regulatory domain-containing protein [Flavobacterium sp.]